MDVPQVCTPLSGMISLKEDRLPVCFSKANLIATLISFRHQTSLKAEVPGF